MSALSPSSTVENPPRPKGPSVGVRVGGSAAAGALSALVVAILGPWWLIPLSGWDMAALIFVIWMWRSLWSLDAAGTAKQARRENPRRAAADSLLLSASIASLIAVGLVLVRAGHSSGLTKGLLIGLGVASIILAWSVVHTVFILRYAKLYYEGIPGGVDFNEEEPPLLHRLRLPRFDDRNDLPGLGHQSEDQGHPPDGPAPRAALLRVRRAHHRDDHQPHRRANQIAVESPFGRASVHRAAASA